MESRAEPPAENRRGSDAPFLKGKLTAARAPRMRALVPFGIPSTDTGPDALCNRFAFLSAKLAVAEGSTQSRVMATNKVMTKIKQSMQAAAGLWLANSVNPRLPLAMAQDTGKGIFARHSVVFSNVPGPAEPVFFCGRKVTDILNAYNNVLPQVILVSYDGVVRCTLSADPADVDGSVLAE